MHENEKKLGNATHISFPARSPWGHKGDFGTVLLIGGSRGMSGAIALSSRSALMIGAGLVRAAVPDRVLETVAAYIPEITTVPLPEDRKGRISLDAFPQILHAIEQADVIAIGPGLGRSLGLNVVIERLYRCVEKPMIFDADALNALAERGVFDYPGDKSGSSPPENPRFPRILTPHPGEFARLSRKDVISEQGEQGRKNRVESARSFARKNRVILILKGHESVITDGEELAINTTGNPGMGTGGSGDVLTGILAGLIAQGLSPLRGAILGAHLHGSAGDFAAKELGFPSLTAGSIIDFLPKAIRHYQQGKE